MFLKFFKKRSNIFFVSLVFISALFEILFRISESFSEFYCINVFPVVKMIYLPANLIPFAFSESIIIALILLAVIFFVMGIIKMFFAFFKKQAFPFFAKILAGVMRLGVIVLFLFSLTFSASYHRKPLSELASINVGEITLESLEKATEYAAKKLWEISEQIEYRPEQMSHSGMTFNELSLAVKEDVDKACKEYTFLTKSRIKAKPIALSVPMTYTHISGIYTFFTGEPCINTNYAQYSLPFTIAHEYSHQIGIAPENETDFMAFLILSESKSPYLKYSAWSEAFLILSNELYLQNPDSYRKIVLNLPPLAITDYTVSSGVYSKYSNSAAGEIAKKANDTYLKANGVESGVNSYSESVILLVSYLTK